MFRHFASGILTTALACGAVMAQQRPSMVMRGTNTRAANIANATTNVKMDVGTVAGYIFWDSRRVAYAPSVPCQGLQVALSSITATGTRPLGTSSQFQPMQTSQPGSSLGMCSYSFQRVPEGVALQVQVTVGQPFASKVAAKGPLGPTGSLIKIPGGNCNPSSGTSPSATYLESGWQGCGDHAYNVNFQLVPRNTMGTLPPPTGGALLQRSSGMLLPAQPQNTESPSNGGTSMLVPAVKTAPNGRPGSFTGGLAPSNGGGNNVALNPQPLPPKGTSLIGGNGSSQALIGLLRKQGSLKVVSGKRTTYALVSNSGLISALRQQKQAGQISAGQTMSASAPSISSRLAERPNVALKSIRQYEPSSLLSTAENRACEQQENQGAAPTILRVDGKTTGVKYSPDPQANPYTIVGCGFGDSTGGVQLLLQQQVVNNSGWGNSQSYSTVNEYSVNLTIQSWSDHEIVAALDPNTSGIPDWSSNVLLSVKARLTGYQFGNQFVASRQTVLLSSIAQNECSLYQTGSPYFLSPVSNYYGLNGTAAVMRQGLSGPVAGQDQFNVKLAPGYVVDSTQTDLLVSDTNSNVTSQPATLNGNTITVTYPVVSAQSGNSTVYYSMYGLKIWVTGPAGISPVAK